MTSPAPLTVIGGFLGAGKTTLVNHLLLDAARSGNGVRYAVLVNDFGDLAIDESLIAKHDGQTIALANGCICCTIGDDLIETIMILMSGDKPPEHLIIEASGIADPAPIAEIGSLDPMLTRDLSVVVIDAEQIRTQWEDELLRDTVKRQLVAADLFVLNKAGGTGTVAVEEIRIWLAERNPEAGYIRADDANVPLSLLTGHRGTKQSLPSEHPPDHAVRFTSNTLDIARTTSRAAFMDQMKGLPAGVLRAKGFVELEGEILEFQKVGPRSSLRKATVSGAAAIGKIVIIEIGNSPAS